MSHLNVRLPIFLGVWSAVLLFSGFKLYQYVQNLSEAADSVAYTHEVLESNQYILTAIVDAETGERGYLITGKPVSLEPFHAALANLSAEIRRVESLVQDNPRQVAQIQEIQKLTSAMVRQLQETIAQHGKDPEGARRAFMAQQTTDIMVPIREGIEAMRKEELALLADRLKANDKAHHTAIFAGVMTGILGLCGMVGLFLLIMMANRERDRAEQDRERQRRFLLVTMRSLGDALITTDATGAVEFINPVAEALTGWEQGEASGRPVEQIFNLIDELTKSPAVNPVEILLRERTGQGLANHAALGLAKHAALVSRDGHVIPIEDSAAPIFGDSGDCVGVVLVFHDVTERRKAEIELARSEMRFRKLTELSPNAIWVNRNDRIELVNPEGLLLMGATSEDQIEGMEPLQIFHPDCHEKVMERLRAVRNGQVVRLSEETVVRLDGTLRHVEVSCSSFEDLSGPAIQVVLRDVTTRKQSERDLIESEERFRLLFETAPVPYALFSKIGQTMAINRRFQETFGYKIEDIPTIQGWWRRAYRDPKTYRTPEEYWGSIAAHGAEEETGFSFTGKRKIRCKDGILRTVEFFGLFQQDKVLVTFFDLTEHLREEAERHEFEERTIQAQRLEALGILVAGVAHNFNNILAIIMGTASMQEEIAKDPSQLEALRIIDTACQRGRGLVRSLTHFARPSVPNQIPIQLSTLIAELRLLLGNTARKNISIIEVLPDEPAWILGDPGSFNSALMNLCLNSLDAMPGGGTLTLRTAIPEPDTVEVSVEDTGEGMTPEILKRVTEPFFTTKAVDKGTGLGLSITHGVVKAHGGTMKITSTPGQGTQVKLRIPRHTVLPTQETATITPQQNLELSKVLVVDDEEEVRTMLASMLTMAGAKKVKTVASGQEALVSLDTGDTPDLIILDHNMPGLNGAQTLALIRAGHQNIPIILASGEPDIEGLDQFKQKNVGIIPKPFSLNEFQKVCAELGVGTDSTGA